MLSSPNLETGTLVVNKTMDVPGSVFNDAIVQPNCSLHIGGDLLGNLTIEAGAKVIVEGSIDGKILNKGGSLIVNNRGIGACAGRDGPPESEATGVLRINLSTLALNWDALVRRSTAECAGVVRSNAYGCGVEPVIGTLNRIGCRTFFVSNIPEAKRVRAIAPQTTIYVLNGFYSGTAPVFAEINARPVINSTIEFAEWDMFVASHNWAGGCALNVDTGKSRFGLSFEEAAALAATARSHNVKLVMSRLDDPDNKGLTGQQIARLHELRRLFDGASASLAGSAGIFLGPRTHFDLVRAGSALFGVNPTPGSANPMLPVLELKARVLQVRELAAGEAMEDFGFIAKRRARVALLSIGCADGYPPPAFAVDHKLQAIVGDRRCSILGRPSLDLLLIDVTNLSELARTCQGEWVTLIGRGIGIDDVAAATRTAGREVMTCLGNRFHRIYHAD